MKTEQSRNLLNINYQKHVTESSKAMLLDSERIKWKSYMNYSGSHSDSIRISLTEYIYKLMKDKNRVLFHLTTTYKPYQQRTYGKRDIDTFFKNFYVKHLLPKVLGTKNIHTVGMKSIQPITITFVDEHHLSIHSDRLHHHSILCVHLDTLDFFKSLPEENPFTASGTHTKKLCTSHIRECEPMTLLYASKMMKKYPDYLIFPDKFYRVHH